MKECEWTRKICKDLELQGCLVFAIVGGPRQASGWPDRLIIHREHMVFIEFKAAKCWLTRLQDVIHKAIRRHGRHAFIARMPGELWFGDEFIGHFDSAANMLQFIVSFRLLETSSGEPRLDQAISKIEIHTTIDNKQTKTQ
jgi:hypothetical protein